MFQLPEYTRFLCAFWGIAIELSRFIVYCDFLTAVCLDGFVAILILVALNFMDTMRERKRTYSFEILYKIHLLIFREIF